jgi:hypothetical protein
VNTPEWDVMNNRRYELICKIEGEGLSPLEQAEYETLQRGAMAALAKAFPPDPTFSEQLARVKARIAAQEAKGGS